VPSSSTTDPKALEQALDALGAEAGQPKDEVSDLAKRLRAYVVGFGGSHVVRS